MTLKKQDFIEIRMEEETKPKRKVKAIYANLNCDFETPQKNLFGVEVEDQPNYSSVPTVEMTMQVL